MKILSFELPLFQTCQVTCFKKLLSATTQNWRTAVVTGAQLAYTHPCNPSTLCHTLCPELHYKDPQVAFFRRLHWHDSTGFSGTGLAQQKESVLPCGLFLRNAPIKLPVRAANGKKPTDPGFIWSHQYIFVEKPWRMFRFLSPTCFKLPNNWKKLISK